MSVFLPLIMLSLAATSQANPLTHKCFSPIDWSPCSSLPAVQCASYKVPLDYALPEKGIATIALARIQSTTTPKLGTFFVNPGGPGDGGVEFVQAVGSVLSLLTNGQYDVVGWDPRGIGNSFPRFTCGFKTQDEFTGFFNNTIINTGIEARGNFTDSGDLARFYSTVDTTDAILKKFGQKCNDADGSFLKYMGTTAVVRDMVSIADCLDGPNKPINYYGKSYGTVIGSYFVNMFPKRVGRVIIDGVIDSILWATAPSFNFLGSTFKDTDFVLESFANLCATAGSSNCSLAQQNSTGTSILMDIRQLIDSAYDAHKSGQSNISSFDIRTLIYDQLSTPTTWDKDIADQVVALKSTIASQTNETSPILRRSRLNAFAKYDTASIDPDLPGALASPIVPCLDSIDQEHITTRRVYDEIVQVTQHISSFFGELGPAPFLFNCHRFPVRAVERFQGPFNAKLQNPILVIGNKGDPKTPLANARKIANALGKSARLLEQDGFGHTSFTMTSDCTIAAMRQYLLTGDLPPAGSICSTDQALFPPNATLATTLNSSG